VKQVYLGMVCILFVGCATVGSLDRPESYYQNSSEDSSIGLVDSVGFGDDDQRIAKLLAYQVKLPRQSRIAILKLSTDNYWRFYSNDFTRLNTSLMTSFIAKLRASDRVYDASFLPTMLVSEQRTVPVLREAAARFQADLLLAYRSSCQSYQKYRFIEANETKSYCAIESVLLDVRSGVIVKSVVSSEDYSAAKKDGDLNFNETIKRAELEAVARALGRVADEVVAFLSDVPVLQL
jgi:hypothetical protein